MEDTIKTIATTLLTLEAYHQFDCLNITAADIWSKYTTKSVMSHCIRVIKAESAKENPDLHQIDLYKAVFWHIANRS